MDNILPTEEYTEVEGRVYSNPQATLQETSDFIENLRATQGEQNQEITQQTQRLGTDVPTVLGGLTGADSYFTSRYQTPQTNANVANLRATAQAAALNEVLANEQAIWKKRYQDAYRNYQKRQYNRAKSAYSGGGGGGTTTPSTSQQVTGGVEENPTDEQGVYSYTSSVTAQPGYYTVIGPDGYAHLVDMETGEETEIAPPAGKGNTGSGGMGWSGGGSGGGGRGGGR